MADAAAEVIEAMANELEGRVATASQPAGK